MGVLRKLGATFRVTVYWKSTGSDDPCVRVYCRVMIVAVLFNSDDPRFGGYYGPPIRDLVFGTSVLQSSRRHMKIKHGDVLIYGHARTRAEFEHIAEATYFNTPWSRLKDARLRATYMQQTVWAWVIQNVTRKIAEDLHEALSSDAAYLGLHAVDYSLPQHLALYRNSMPAYCRIAGDRCALFYSMGSEDDRDEFEAQHLRTLGFGVVEWEDTGAHGTIFDDFDTLEHFQQVREVQAIFAGGTVEGDYAAEELVMMLEDLSPRLFNTLGAAVRALNRAQNEEDIAHVGLSARRYFEQLADALFPASAQPHNGRDVTQARYRNRIWAFIDQAVADDVAGRKEVIQALGKEVDRLIEDANSMLHGKASKESSVRILLGIAQASIALLQLDPRAVRKPYDAFKESMLKFLKELERD